MTASRLLLTGAQAARSGEGGGQAMSDLVLVPFDGAPASVEALRSVCSTARLEGSAVVALYVARVPRQLPLSAGLPSLVQEA